VLAALSWRLPGGALRAGRRVKAHRVVMPMAVSPDRRGGTGWRACARSPARWPRPAGAPTRA